MLNSNESGERKIPGTVRRMLGFVQKFSATSAEAQQYPTNILEHDDVDNANVVISKVAGTSEHYPVLDLDYPVELVPSSTPGHFHLYIDKAVPEDKYWDFLRAMVEAGLLQEGFANNSEARGFTAARLPWVKKKDDD